MGFQVKTVLRGQDLVQPTALATVMLLLYLSAVVASMTTTNVYQMGQAVLSARIVNEVAGRFGTRRQSTQQAQGNGGMLGTMMPLRSTNVRAVRGACSL